MTEAPEWLTTQEVANALRASPSWVRRKAKSLNLGINLGGRAGYRFTRDDVAAIVESMRPPEPIPRRRRRRLT